MSEAMPGTREMHCAPSPGSSVACPLKGGAQIGNGRCVEWQRDNGCHCENALVALRGEEERLLAYPDPVPREDQRNKGVPSARAIWQQQQQQLQEVRQLIARAEQIEKSRPVPEPAEEETVSHLTERTCGWKESPCSEKLGESNKSGLCNPHNSVMYARKKAAEKKGATATHAPKPRKANKERQRMRSPEPASGDVVGILRSRLAHHEEQAAKIAKALEVLA